MTAARLRVGLVGRRARACLACLRALPGLISEQSAQGSVLLPVADLRAW